MNLDRYSFKHLEILPFRLVVPELPTLNKFGYCDV